MVIRQIQCVVLISNPNYLSLPTVTITYLNCHSVSLATGTQNVFTAAKLTAIMLIVIGGFLLIFKGETQHISKGFEGSKFSFSDIATAFYSGLWAYDGW